MMFVVVAERELSETHTYIQRERGTERVIQRERERERESDTE